MCNRVVEMFVSLKLVLRFVLDVALKICAFFFSKWWPAREPSSASLIKKKDETKPGIGGSPTEVSVLVQCWCWSRSYTEPAKDWFEFSTVREQPHFIPLNVSSDIFLNLPLVNSEFLLSTTMQGYSLSSPISFSFSLQPDVFVSQVLCLWTLFSKPRPALVKAQ